VTGPARSGSGPRGPLDRSASELAAELQDLLGQKVVAFALGDRDPKTIGRYARADRQPDDAAHRRLVDLHGVVQILKTGMRAETVKSWMLGANPRLDGRAPVELLHDDDVDRVRVAARFFVSNQPDCSS
jgi:hypothetical protein